MKKKIVFLRESERESFKRYCESIKSLEKDKDEFLKASRLERHESKREPLGAADAIKIIVILAVALICCTALVLGYLSGDLISIMIGLIVFVTLVGIGVVMLSV